MAEHSFEMKVTVTTEDIIDFLSMEGNGFDYWAEICTEDQDYKDASIRLFRKMRDAKKKPAALCYEEVLAEILEGGGKLTIYDREEDKDHELTLEGLLDGFKLYAESVYRKGSIGLDDMDAIVADQILQMAVFKEIIYG